jgi:putative transposase
MLIPSSMPRLKGYRFPREVVAYAVWAYHRFALSTADVEELLAARGVIVSRETIRLWVNRFGAHFAACIRRDRPRPNDKWHMDEVVIPINGVKHWLWRAVDTNGDTLDILVQTRRNTKPISRQASGAGHRAHNGLNNRIESSHRPTRRREKSWGDSSHPGKHSGSSPPMTRSTPSENHAAIASPPTPIIMQELMRSASGPIMPAR